MAIEEPEYKVDAKTHEYEIRSYGPVIVAEVKVNAGFERAGNIAFRILAEFIFGNNKSRAKIEMMAPFIQQAPKPEKIAMTAPVNQFKYGPDSFVIQFTMPKKYTPETLPQPNDPRVKIREIPARKLAIYSYSGSWSQSRYQEKLDYFRKELGKANLETKGEPVFARYNSPYQLWFLRRNEICMLI